MLITLGLYAAYFFLTWGALSVIGAGWLGFAAYVPFIAAVLRHKSKKGAFFFPVLFGFLTQWALLYWLMYVNRPPGGEMASFIIGLVAPTLLSGYLSIWTGLLGLFVYSVRKKNLWPALFIIPTVISGLEWARGQLFTGFPWNFLGHSMARMPVFIQAADLAGEILLSWLVALVNVIILVLIAAGLKKNLFNAPRSFKDRQVAFVAAFGVFVLAAWLGYGAFRLKQTPEGRPGPTVAIIQGNVPQDIKNDFASDFRAVLKNYEEEARAAINAGKIDLMVFPETILPYPVVENDRRMIGAWRNNPWQWLRKFRMKAGCEILIGNVHFDDFVELPDGRPTPGVRVSENRLEPGLRNRVTFLDEKGKIKGFYDKMHLVPFGEYVPMKEYIPKTWLRALIPPALIVNQCWAGEGMKVLTASAPVTGAKPTKFAVVICYEDVVAEICRDAVKKGAEMIIVVTNEGWYLDTYQMDQHVSMAAIRAVENRVPVLRSANTGISCHIDSAGRIKKIVTQNGRAREVKGFIIAEPEIDPRKTLFTMTGETFAIACLVFTLGLAAVNLFGRKKEKKNVKI